MATPVDPLHPYHAKRDFTRTPEPKGAPARRPGNRFLVQKHAATRLHFDLRLEIDGVLKSWAVTRGPSLDPAAKRLAVRTEDHPIDYADFEGTIPPRAYGGGTVMLWDEGTWAPIAGKSAADLDAGHLHFVLDGQRMKGEWLLVRMKPRAGEKRENWLLRKVADAHAGQGDSLVEQALTSVRTGRTMAEIAQGAKPARGAARRGPSPKAKSARALPAFRPLQLATLVERVPAGDDWLHEVKFDGYRCLIAADRDRVVIYTRTGLDWTDRFGAVARAVAALDLPGALIDGEIVVAGADGNPSFSALQQALHDGRADPTLIAFDLLALDGQDLTGLANIERKQRLAALLPDQDPASGAVRVAAHIRGGGDRLLATLCAAGQEGIISKKADARYVGRRTHAWLKVKCGRRQEFVIVGWLPSEARGRPFKSLLLARHDDDGNLTYAGKVGTGFGGAAMDRLCAAMAPLARDTPTVAAPKAETRGARWIAPRLVAEIAFAEFTGDGIVRHARFIRLREDKSADAVRDEEPVALADPADDGISHPDRVVFADGAITKGQLAEYYRTVAPLMLPWAAGRPISLVRCPQGIAKHCFMQKHDNGGLGDDVLALDIADTKGKAAPYLYIEQAAGLIDCVQMNTIEFHGWGARCDDVERPDRMVFDLDPDTGVDFAEVKRAAQDIRAALADVGLTSFAMLSGGKGIHVVVPLTPEARWPAVKDFAQRFATALAQATPARFTASMAKARRQGRIFIDWLRNQRGATAVLPYSVRARPGAPVAAPIDWGELDGIQAADRFTLADAARLIDRAQALRGWGQAAQTLPDL